MGEKNHCSTGSSGHNKWSKYILIFVSSLVLILVIWCVCMMIGSLGVVKNITVRGDTPYSVDRIVAVSGIERGMKIKKVNSKNIKNNILEILPCISDVSVKKKVGGEVIVDVTSEEIRYVANISDERYVMSDEFRVLCLEGTVNFDSFPLEVSLPDVKRAIVGQTVEFFDDGNFINDFIEIIDSSKLSDGVTFIDFSNKYNLKLLYEDKYTVCFGDLGDINLKLQKVYMIMDDASLKDQKKAIIDVSDVAHPTVKLLS